MIIAFDIDCEAFAHEDDDQTARWMINQMLAAISPEESEIYGIKIDAQELGVAWNSDEEVWELEQ